MSFVRTGDTVGIKAWIASRVISTTCDTQETDAQTDGLRQDGSRMYLEEMGNAELNARWIAEFFQDCGVQDAYPRQDLIAFAEMVQKELTKKDEEPPKKTRFLLGRVNTTKRFDDQSEMDKGDKHHVEFLKTRKDAAKALEPAKQVAQSRYAACTSRDRTPKH